MAGGNTRIGIVVAMQSELDQLLELLPHASADPHEPFATFDIECDRGPAMAVCAGIGLVDAAAATQWLIGKFRPERIVNFGCAGAHNPSMLPGDVVIADRFVNPAAARILKDGTMRHVGFTAEEDQGSAAQRYLLPDPEIFGELLDTANSQPVEPWPNAKLDCRAPSIFVGGVASADIWTQFPSRINEIAAEHGTLCEDMEAIAVARACQRNSIPFASVKDISNNELLQATDLDHFSDFPVGEVGKRSATIIASWLNQRL